jgi:hypothetical protein
MLWALLPQAPSLWQQLLLHVVNEHWMTCCCHLWTLLALLHGQQQVMMDG